MMKYCYPQLRTANAFLWATEFSSLAPLEVLKQRAPHNFEGVFYTPLGAPRVPPELLSDLRESVLSIARDAGYPHERSTAGQRIFDEQVAKLFSEIPIIPAEAYRNEVWQFLSCRLLPDVIVWRFGDLGDNGAFSHVSTRRFLGGVRNGFQRLWLRSFVLFDESAEDPLWLLDPEQIGLTEDNYLQIIERSGLSSNRRLLQNFIVEFVRYRKTAAVESGIGAEFLFREAAKHVLRILAYANLEVIDESLQSRILQRAFEAVIDPNTILTDVKHTYAPTKVETPDESKRYHQSGAPEELKNDEHRGVVEHSERAVATDSQISDPTISRAHHQGSQDRVFRAIAFRVLQAIDLPNTSSSNQHEIQGVRALRDLLGSAEREFQCHWHVYQRNGQISEEIKTRVKWYDARARSQLRSEWRLYYPKNTPLNDASVGDGILFATVGKNSDAVIYAYVIPQQAISYLMLQDALARESTVQVSDELERFIRTRLTVR